MAVLVTCKFDEDPIKIECIINRTKSTMGFSDVAGSQTHPRFYGCPGYLQD